MLKSMMQIREAISVVCKILKSEMEFSLFLYMVAQVIFSKNGIFSPLYFPMIALATTPLSA